MFTVLRPRPRVADVCLSFNFAPCPVRPLWSLSCSLIRLLLGTGYRHIWSQQHHRSFWGRFLEQEPRAVVARILAFPSFLLRNVVAGFVCVCVRGSAHTYEKSITGTRTFTYIQKTHTKTRTRKTAPLLRTIARKDREAKLLPKFNAHIHEKKTPPSASHALLTAPHCKRSRPCCASPGNRRRSRNYPSAFRRDAESFRSLDVVRVCV